MGHYSLERIAGPVAHLVYLSHNLLGPVYHRIEIWFYFYNSLKIILRTIYLLTLALGY